MTFEEQEAVVQLRILYNSIHDNLDDILDACENGAQKRQIGDSLQRALKNYIDAQNHILGRSADLILQVRTKATQAQQFIDQSLQNLQNIKAVLNTITTVINDVATVVAALA